MKDRRRYIAFEVIGRQGKSEIYREIVGRCEVLGVEVKLRMVLYDIGSRRGLLLCNHRQVDKVKEVMSGAEWIKVLGVSGTIKCAKRKFLSEVQGG